MSLRLDAMQQNVDRIATTQDQMTRSVDRIAPNIDADHEQMTRSINKISASQEQIARSIEARDHETAGDRTAHPLQNLRAFAAARTVPCAQPGPAATACTDGSLTARPGWRGAALGCDLVYQRRVVIAAAGLIDPP